MEPEVKKKGKAKVIAIVLILVLLFVCGGTYAMNNTDLKYTLGLEQKYQLGDTVSTDLADFTLDAATFTYYASSFSTLTPSPECTYCKPIDESDGGIYKASAGHALVAMTFTINNKDRTTLDIGGTFGEWELKFTAKYNGEEYSVNGYDLNDRDGRTTGISLGSSAVSIDGGKSFVNHGSDNELQSPGVETYRTVGVISVDPESLDDSFDLTVPVLNSAGEYEYFTYEVK